MSDEIENVFKTLRDLHRSDWLRTVGDKDVVEAHDVLTDGEPVRRPTLAQLVYLEHRLERRPDVPPEGRFVASRERAADRELADAAAHRVLQSRGDSDRRPSPPATN